MGTAITGVSVIANTESNTTNSMSNVMPDSVELKFYIIKYVALILNRAVRDVRRKTDSFNLIILIKFIGCPPA